MVNLTRSLCSDRTVAASSDNVPVTLPPLSPNGTRQSPSSPMRSSESTSQVPTVSEQKPEPPAAAPNQVTTPRSGPSSDTEKPGKLEGNASVGQESSNPQPIQRKTSHFSHASCSPRGDVEDDHE